LLGSVGGADVGSTGGDVWELAVAGGSVVAGGNVGLLAIFGRSGCEGAIAYRSSSDFLASVGAACGGSDGGSKGAVVKLPEGALVVGGIPTEFDTVPLLEGSFVAGDTDFPAGDIEVAADFPVYAIFSQHPVQNAIAMQNDITIARRGYRQFDCMRSLY
jgi:hypothetical protein